MRLFYKNCSLDIAACEVPDSVSLAFGGVAGKCNLTTQVCECPSSHSGTDVVGRWNDCHVHVTVSYALQAVATGFLAFVTVVAIVASVRILLLWEVIKFATNDDDEEPSSNNNNNNNNNNNANVRSSKDYMEAGSPNPRGSYPLVHGSPMPLSLRNDDDMSDPNNNNDNDNEFPDTSASMPVLMKKKSRKLSVSLPTFDRSALQSPKANAPTTHFRHAQMERRRRRHIIVLLINLFVYLLLSIGFFITRFNDVVIEDINEGQLICLAGSISCLVLALWAGVYIWYSSLPSLAIFAKMFPEIASNPLIRFPGAVRVNLIVNVITILLTTFVLIIVLPNIDPHLINDATIPWGLTLVAILLTMFLVTTLILGILLLKIFAMVQDNSGNKVANNSSSPVAITGRKTLVGSPNNNAARERSFADRIRDARRIVQAVIVLVLTIGPLGVALLLAFAWGNFAERFFSVFYSALMMLGSLIVLFLLYIFTLKMKSSSASKREREERSRKNSNSNGGGGGVTPNRTVKKQLSAIKQASNGDLTGGGELSSGV